MVTKGHVKASFTPQIAHVMGLGRRLGMVASVTERGTIRLGRNLCGTRGTPRKPPPRVNLRLTGGGQLWLFAAHTSATCLMRRSSHGHDHRYAGEAAHLARDAPELDGRRRGRPPR